MVFFRDVKKIAADIERICGLHGGDALQVASAKIAGAKYFITTDEGISERAKCISKETGILSIQKISWRGDYGDRV